MSRALLPWLAVAVFLAVVAAWVLRDRRLPHEAFAEDSVHNASDRGLSAAFRYLEDRGRRVEALTRLVEPGALHPRGVVFRIRPEIDRPPALERAFDPEALDTAEKPPPEVLLDPREEAWVRGGGRLVLAIDGRYGPLGSEPSIGDGAVKVFPAWPGVERLQPPVRRRLTGPAPGHAVFADAKGPSVVRDRRGEGEVVVLATPEIFRNEALGRADHLGLLERLAGEDRPVYFDEYVHALRSEVGPLEVLRGWGFGPFLIFAAAAWILSVWRRRARLGPPDDDARETRMEAVDVVDSLALLYDRVLLRRQALALYARALEREAAVRTGLRGPALEARVRELLRARPSRPKGRDVPPEDFARELREINDAFRRLSDERRVRRGGKAAGRPRPS